MPSIFLSHNSKDKPFARKLGNDLKRNGAGVWIDEAEIKFGDSLIEKISHGLLSTEYLFALLSRNSVKSEWVKRELNTVLTEEINGRQVKVIPVLLEDCEIPAFLRDKKYVDFRGFYKNELSNKYVDTIREIVAWLGLSADPIQREMIQEDNFLRHFIFYDLLIPDVEGDVRAIVWLNPSAFARIIDRLNVFGISLQGVEVILNNDVDSLEVYLKEDFAPLEQKKNRWASTVIETHKKKAGVLFSASYHIPEKVLRIFGFD